MSELKDGMTGKEWLNAIWVKVSKEYKSLPKFTKE